MPTARAMPPTLPERYAAPHAARAWPQPPQAMIDLLLFGLGRLRLDRRRHCDRRPWVRHLIHRRHVATPTIPGHEHSRLLHDRDVSDDAREAGEPPHRGIQSVGAAIDGAIPIAAKR